MTLGLTYFVLAGLYLDWGGPYFTEPRYLEYRERVNLVVWGHAFLVVAVLLLLPSGTLPAWWPKREWVGWVSGAQNFVAAIGNSALIYFVGLNVAAAYRLGTTPTALVMLPLLISPWLVILRELFNHGQPPSARGKR